MMIDILIPTYNRLTSVAVLLSSLYFQEEQRFEIYISDQNSEYDILDNQSIKTLIRLLQLQGHIVSVYKNLPRRGMAQQRNFLLHKSQAEYVLYLDDDVFLESFVLKLLLQVIQKEKCGLVGMGLIGPSFVDDIRSEEQQIEFWHGKVKPEQIEPGSGQWERYKAHNAANLWHINQKWQASVVRPLRYKIAWVGGCVLFDRQKLLSVNGFDFETTLPREHVGEDVAVQQRVMSAFGGCGILPSGVYHQELETTLPNRTIDIPFFLRGKESYGKEKDSHSG